MTEAQVLSIQRVQDHIRMHIDQPLTLIELSRVAAYSPSQTERLFRELTGKSLFETIRLMRLTAAAKVMKTKRHIKIVDVSLDFLFDSHEGFTRAFSKAFGVSPKAYQKKPRPVPYFLPYDVMAIYRHQNRTKEGITMAERTIFTQVVLRPKRMAIIKRATTAKEYFKYCEEVGCDVWGILESIPNALYEPVGFWLPEHLIPAGTSTYVQGVEVPMDDDTPLPEGFDRIVLEPCQVMIFQGNPYDDEYFAEEISALRKAIDQYNPEIYGYRFDESHPRFQLAPQGYRGYIEGRPVRKI